MQKLTIKDLEDVFLLIIRPDKEHRKTLPIVRRHFKSVSNVCKILMDRSIDIYLSGVLVAHKKRNERKIIMTREYREIYKDQPLTFQV